MELQALDAASKAGLAEQYIADGIIHLEDVELPDSFMPPVSDVVFVAISQNDVLYSEVYINSGIQYEGAAAEWQRICSQPPGPGGSVLVASVRGDFLSGLRLFQQLLEQAGGRVPQPQSGNAQHRDNRQAPVEHTENRVFALRDLVEEARRVSRHFAGREDILKGLLTNLVRKTKQGVVLTGIPGVGKTSIVLMLAERIASNDGVPEELQNIALYEFPLGTLIENAQHIGGVERQMRQILNENNHNSVFFVDELHQIARQELRGVCDLLKPALADGRVRLIGATTTREWTQFQDRAFKRRFTELVVPEPTPKEAYLMLQSRIRDIVETRGMEVPDEVAKEAIAFADRYLPHRAFPDKAIDLVDHAAALQVTDRATSVEHRNLSRDYVQEAAAFQSNLPKDFLDRATFQYLVNTTITEARRRILGQDPAFERLRNTLQSRVMERFIGWDEAVRTLRRPLADRRPLACVLAVGPTGVGKTETAKFLADRFFNGRMVFLNGSDVGPEASHGVSMWTGSPPGYVGSDQGGVLTDGLRTHKSAVIVVDEIEKAAPGAIQNCLLPLLGEGLVMDRNNGDSLWATECIVFCTSNAVTDIENLRPMGFQRALGNEETTPDERMLHQALGRYLREEVIARFNCILYYSPLNHETCRSIWVAMVNDLEERIGPGTSVQFEADAQNVLESKLAKTASGARGLRDFFRDCIIPLAADARPGDTVRIGAIDEKLVRINK